MKVSICVPAYERPDTIAKLIESVNEQSHEDIELVISDDSQSSSVEDVVRSTVGVPLSYARNQPKLGFAGNLRQTLCMATGDIVVVLGDDDRLADAGAIARYVEVALRYPSVGFSYSNLVQFDESGNVSLIHRYFVRDQLFSAGADALEKVWLRSVQIAGMCFHMRGAEVAEVFPTFESLFPQVIAAGRVLSQRDGFGHSGLLVGTRVSGTQLGYQVASGAERVSERASLGGAELLDIVGELQSAEPGVMNTSVRATVERQIVGGFVGSLPNLRLFCGRSDIRRMFSNYSARTRLVWRMPQAVLVAACVVVLPRSTIRLLVRVMKPAWLWWTRARMGVRPFLSS